jgi:hypothetical protein
MPSFVLAFRGGMPKSPEEGQKMMADWNAWIAALGPKMTDKGAGFGKSRYLTSAKTEGPCPSPLSGYSLVEAGDIEAALDLARGCPIFALGGTVEVAEAMQM